MKITEINRFNDFISLRKEWGDALEKSNHTIFSTWEWLSTWWKYFGNDKRLLLLLAEEDGEIRGIAPLMYSVHKMFGLRRGKIEFIGNPHSDYNDFILVDKEKECVTLFVDHLKSFGENWDCIDLSEIPENSKSLEYLSYPAKSIRPVHKCPFIYLPKSYPEFLKMLDSKQKKNLRRSLKFLESNYKVEFCDSSDSQQAIKGINAFFDLHRKRWASKGYAGEVSTIRLQNFHTEIADVFSRKKWLGLFLLKLSDKPVAALYGFRYKSRFYFYLSGFDPSYSKYSVGNLLLLRSISDCIGDEFREFDFMRGAEEYKDRWNTKTRWNQRAILTGKGKIGYVQNWFFERYWDQGNRFLYLLKLKK